MSSTTVPRTGRPPGAEALAAVAAGAAARDAAPEFPADAFAALAQAGALLPAGDRAAEWAAVRAVAAADGSVGRLYEGHLNGVERLALLGDPELVEHELAAVADGERLLGVWGADPGPGEGEPARLVAADTPSGWRVEGVKTYCSGAGGLHRALITARGPGEPGPPWLVYVDLRDVAVDRDWYRASGMRASESHRVEFAGAPVVAVLGEPGELVRQPFLAGDAIRTAAAWAGMADAAADAALADLAGKPGDVDELRALAAGRIEARRATMDAWFAAAAAGAPEALPAASLPLRLAVAEAGAAILDEAGRACGSRPFATGAALDRIRRDFQLFVLQHRLDPQTARLGRAAVEARR